MPLKYSDYVKNDDLNLEIEQAAKAKVKSTIPESVIKRFDGKTTEEILESYANLENKFSSQGQDLGKLRKQVDQLIELQLQSPVQNPTEPDEPVEPVTIDNLYEDAEGNITKVVEKSTKKSNERINQLEDQLNEISNERRVAELNNKYNDWVNEIQTEDFANWVKESNYRLRLVQAADKYDFDAANDLLGMWYDHKNIQKQVEEKAQRESTLKAATLETSSPTGVSAPETYSRSELLEKRIRARQGDRVAERWLRAHADSITAAYEEGRISD